MNRSHPFVYAAVLAISLTLPGTVSADNALAELPTVNQALTLNKALALATANNITLKQAGMDAMIAEAAARSATAQTRPSLSATTYGLSGDSSNIVSSSPGVMPQNIMGIAPHGYLDQNLMLMVPLFTGGKLSGQAGAARAQSQGAVLTAEAAALTTQETVIAAYTASLLKTALVQTAEARLAAEEEQVRVTEERVSSGRSAPVSLLREQAEEAGAKQGLLAAQTDAALAVIQLKTALGISQMSNITFADTLDTAAAPATLPASLQDAIQTAETSRPDLAAALKQAEAARESSHAVRGAYSPQIYALGMADASALSSGDGRVGYTVGLTASIPLYDGGQRDADADASKARLDRTILEAQSLRQTVDQEVASAWITLQAATQQVQTARLGVSAAQQAYDLATLRYNAGKSIAAERLDALAALTRAQGDLSAATAAVIEDRARLLAATGSQLIRGGSYPHDPIPIQKVNASLNP